MGYSKGVGFHDSRIRVFFPDSGNSGTKLFLGGNWEFKKLSFIVQEVSRGISLFTTIHFMGSIPHLFKKCPKITEIFFTGTPMSLHEMATV